MNLNLGSRKIGRQFVEGLGQLFDGEAHSAWIAPHTKLRDFVQQSGDIGGI